MKSLMFMLAEIGVGIFFLWAIWPALQGSNDGYTTKTADVELSQPSQTPDAPVSVVTEVVEPEEAPVVPEEVVKPEAVAEEVVTEEAPAAASNEKEDEKTGALYSVVDGNKLDAESYAGFKLFRNWCARCHGTYGQGMAGPDLPESLKLITEKQFFDTVENGKTGSIGSMPNWKANAKVMAGRDQIYAYLMARSDGAIGEVKPKKQ